MRQADRYVNEEQYAKALATYTKVLKSAEAAGNEEAYFNSMRKIANVYAVFGDLERSYYYNKKAYDDALNKQDRNLQSLLLENLVGISYLQRNLQQMRKYMILQERTQMNDKVLWRYYQLCNRGYLSQLEGNSKLGIYYHRQAVTFAKDHEMPHQYVADQLNEIGKAYMRDGDYREAIQFLLDAHRYSKKFNLKELDVNVLRSLSEAYGHENRHDSAGYYKSLYLSISDSLFDKRQFAMAQDSLFEYEQVRNDRHISTLNTKLTRLGWIVLGSSLLLVLAIGITVIIVRNNRRLVEAQRALIERNRQLLKSVEENKILRDRYLKSMEGSDSETAEQTQKNKEQYLSLEMRQILLTRITSVMEDISNISSADFSLQTLAGMVGSNTKYVSWVINDTYGKNFKSFLNEYRIREACRRLSDHDTYGNITLQALAADIGYNSPTSFILAFKKINGMTPSVYQKLSRLKEEQGE